MTMVKESLDEGYCDISGSDDDFALTSEESLCRTIYSYSNLLDP